MQPDHLDLLGGNNPGYDITYTKNDCVYFVEVKGLSGSWDDNDVILSRTQFDLAQKEGEKYSLFVVEFVEEAERRQIWEIKNPASHFNKFQIDYGWREFAEDWSKKETDI
jgi:hypothetical protein